MNPPKRIGIIGGGPAALFLLKHFSELEQNYSIDIFERSTTLGAGMPYSKLGASDEHITNVSANEIPDLETSVEEWMQQQPAAVQKKFTNSPGSFNPYKVFPRLLFGKYLSDEFELLIKKARLKGITIKIFLKTVVKDIIDSAEVITVITDADKRLQYDHVIISIGHAWPVVHEGKIPGYYESPYPPSKLCFKTNDTVAIRGSSLTAIDAVRTLSRQHGEFSIDPNSKLHYQLHKESEGFSMVLYSIDGLLPALRFHLEDSHLQQRSVLTKSELQDHIAQNEGLLSLDFIFEKNFKDLLRQKDPDFYGRIKDMKMETFVSAMMDLREKLEAFTLFKAEYAEAEKSIRRKESVYWKELLAVLSFTMNYPAKYFSAEDMLRLKKTLQPLISVVIAFVPQSSAEELIALHDAGVLNIVAVDKDCFVKPVSSGGATVHYADEENKKHQVFHPVFIDAIGQRPVAFQDFPFKSLLENNTISQADLKFKNATEGEQYLIVHKDEGYKTEAGHYYLKVPGIKINDNFQVLDNYEAANPRLFLMAVPYIAGYNPDYSGLDFCEEASSKIVHHIESMIGIVNE